MKKTIFIIFMLFLLIPLVNAINLFENEIIFYNDDFNDSNITNGGWIKDTGEFLPIIEDTYIKSKSPNGQMYQNFTNISWMDTDWRISARAKKIDNSVTYTTFYFSNNTVGGGTNYVGIYLNQNYGNDQRLTCKGDCSCGDSRIEGGFDSSLHIYDIYYDSSINNLSIYEDSVFKTDVTVSGCNFSEYNLIVFLRDESNRKSFLDYVNITTNDLYPPDITITSPPNNSIINTSLYNVSFKFIDSDDSIFDCGLYINDSLKDNINNVNNNTETEFTNINLDIGKNKVNIKCDYKFSSDYFIIVDTDTLNFTILSPIDNFYYNDGLPINITFYDDILIKNYSVRIFNNSVVIRNNYSTELNLTTYDFNDYINYSEGSFTLNTIVWDYAEHKVNSEIDFFIDRVNPYITFNSTDSNSTGIELFFNTSELVTVDYFLGLSCDTPISSGTRTLNNKFNINNIDLSSETNYYYNITIYDRANNSNNYCFQIETKQLGQIININIKILPAFILLLAVTLWIFLFYVSIKSNNSTIAIITTVYGIFLSLHLFTNTDFPKPLPAILGLANVYILFLLKKK